MNQELSASSRPQQAPSGTILEVQHIPNREGTEIHTNIVLKGHPFPVVWRNAALHQTTSPNLIWHAESCIYCQQCSQVCPNGCLHQGDDALEIDDDQCDHCGRCVKECPSMALEMAGTKITAADLIHKTLKQNYFTARLIRRITITGGEPGLQTAFCADLLMQIEAAGLPSILDTSGLAPFRDLLPLLSRPAQISYELITTDYQSHIRLTGYGNLLILENLLKISDEIQPSTTLVVRTPLIRSETANQDSLWQTGHWLADHLLPACSQWELFEPEMICEPPQTFSNQDYHQIRGWAEASGFPGERIRILGAGDARP